MSQFEVSHSTPVNRASRLDARQLSIQLTRAPLRNPHHLRRGNNSGAYSFDVRTPFGRPTMRLRINLNVIAVDREPRQPRVEIRPAAADAVEENATSGGEGTRMRTRASSRNKKSTCNHALDRKFCAKCHIRRRHLNRWWLRQQYRQH